MKESPIFSKMYDFLRWLIPLTIKFPRQHRFVLAVALQQTALALQERLIEASATDSKQPKLAEADIILTKLRFYLRLCHDLELVSTGQLAHGSQMLVEIGRLLGGWQKSIRV